MHFTLTNVNTAFQYLVQRGQAFSQHPTHSMSAAPSRNGNVVRYVDPMSLTYVNPTQRVLFNRERNCNHFFHLVEAMWMLAGRNDLKLLTYYNKKMAEYSDNGETLSGAYGYRWMNHGLPQIVAELASDHTSRRCYVPLYSPRDNKITSRNSKDICCNLGILFEIADGRLNMSVFNRSNDMIWGSLGANYVHFTILQEVVAHFLQVAVGKYHQISSNLHIYEWNSDFERWLSAYYDITPRSGPEAGISYWSPDRKLLENYPSQLPCNIPLARCQHLNNWLDQVHMFNISEPRTRDLPYSGIEFVDHTVRPAVLAWKHMKHRQFDQAINKIEMIQSEDWRVGCLTYLDNRLAKLPSDVWNAIPQPMFPRTTDPIGEPDPQ